MKQMMIVMNKNVGKPAVLVTTDVAMAQITSMIDSNGNDDVSYKVFNQGEVDLKDLPEDVQAEVNRDLRAYDECNVVFENNKYYVGVGTCIKRSYAYDHFVVGTYKAEEVYTKANRRKNFEEEFGYTAAYMRNW